MNRLIDAMGILDHSICGDIECDYCPFENGSECKLRKRVSELPTIDAVEVVRCKECKYGKNNCYVHGLTLCERPIYDGVDSTANTLMTESDFCSYGERREND